MRLERDRWADGRGSRLSRTDPTADQIEAAVRALDQRCHTEVVLTGHDGQYLAVEGGAGEYLVHLGSDEHDDVIALRTPSAPPGEVDVVAAGQVRRVDRRAVVDLATALRAVRAFAVDGRPDSTLYWGSG
ncbi:Immunity protein Imm1 [Asanoa hainanensis]|uniref:Immunity protein Imm1 n=1 Tax=Asanoa hainanensis TaxID=560556 RepID=A0A239FS26_9ACTN|nr:Imm1 family immunity protein [Asanoa hainanensis]SNS59609.1 Immunity protein Imm1 [Asanoa hainanensis]